MRALQQLTRFDDSIPHFCELILLFVIMYLGLTLFIVIVETKTSVVVSRAGNTLLVYASVPTTIYNLETVGLMAEGCEMFGGVRENSGLLTSMNKLCEREGGERERKIISTACNNVALVSSFRQ